jgi:hypothetical protein
MQTKMSQSKKSQEIPPFHFKTSGNNLDDQKSGASWAGRKLTWSVKHRENLHISNWTAVLVKKNVSSLAQLKLFWEDQFINGKNSFFKT